MESLEYQIDRAAETLPEDWEIRIDVQKGYGEVIVTRPDGTEVPMQDGESDIAEQFRNATLLIRDELEAAALNAKTKTETEKTEYDTQETHENSKA